MADRDAPSIDAHAAAGQGGPRSAPTRRAILAAARARFAAEGYDRATVRAIARDAGVDASMVMRYYESKDQLFAAAADIDLRFPNLAAIPGTRWVRRWLTTSLLCGRGKAALPTH